MRRSHVSLFSLCLPTIVSFPFFQEAKDKTKQENPPKKEEPKKEEKKKVEPADPTQVVDVIVKAKQSQTKTPLDFAGSRTLIGNEELKETGSYLIDDVLRRVPGMTVNNELGNNSKPNYATRGLNPERSSEQSINMDGVPLAPAPYLFTGMSLHAVTMARIYGIDVIRSGYTVAYGPNNVGGVINYLSRPIPEVGTLGETIRVGSWGEFMSYTYGGGTFGKFGILAENVYESGHSFRDNGDYEIKNQAVKMSYAFSENFDVLLQLENFSDHSDQPGGLSLAGYHEDPTQSQVPLDHFRGFQERRVLRANWRLDRDARIEILGYDYDVFRAFSLGGPVEYGANGNPPTRFDYNPDTTHVRALQANYIANQNWLGVPDELLLGGRILWENVDYVRRRQNPYPTAPMNDRIHLKGHTLAYSGYVQDRIHLTDALTITPGVRLESQTSEVDDVMFDTDNTDHNFNLLPAFSIDYLITPQIAVYGNIQESFRSPAISHYTLVSGGSVQRLDPEHAWTYEIGSRGTAFNSALYFDLDLFRMDFRDRILVDTTTPDQSFNNIGSVLHQGIEAYSELDLARMGLSSLEGVTIYGSGTVLDTKIKEGADAGNHSPYASPYKLTWGAKYKHPSGFYSAIDGLWVAGSYSDTKNTETESADGQIGPNPSYSIWNLRAGYDTPISKNASVALLAGVQNLFDEDYYFHYNSKGLIPAQPRNLYTSINFEFRF